ncbi:MAG: DUF5103 domain-containing protein [Cyclobacteriaceae bacterium]|nr:DUF5103 domain-containing protein [Cyclobacteriaceae bacterium]MCH8515983.1 DUF5103 domain-containing protein [Cyclobacteriaceae bacterium]
MRVFIIHLLFIFIAHIAMAQPSQLKYEDKIYDEYTYSVQLYPFGGRAQDVVRPAVIELGTGGLILEFDEVYSELERLDMKIIHCNFDWTPSILRPMEYLFEFNEFPIQDGRNSFDTKIEYVHYRARVPRVKESGNYVLYVYRNGNEDDLILSRRFMVFESSVTVVPEPKVPTVPGNRRTHHQIDFEFRYNNVDVRNPQEEFQVVLRQNQNWNTAIINPRPSIVREHTKTIEFKPFDESTSFLAGNEYRIFDTRVLNFQGQNVARTEVRPDYLEAFIEKSQIRGRDAYSEYRDFNGKFLISNRDRGDDALAADYVYTNFFLETDQEFKGDVYIVGAMNDWQLQEFNKMEYNEDIPGYGGMLFLKQGLYNFKYHYEGSDKDRNALEGNYFQTENQYEIFIYQRPQGLLYDKLVGYRIIQYTER